jgi:hypothetical protein
MAFGGDRPFGVEMHGDVVTTQRDDHPRLAGMLLEALKKQRIMLVEALAKNRAKDFAEYKYLAGQIDGIDIAISFAKEAQKKLDA